MEENVSTSTRSTVQLALATAQQNTVQDQMDYRVWNSQQQVLHLTLRPRPTVTWDDTVINNEGLSRKSSKRCCIFHKKKEFGESSSESEGDDDDDDDGDNISKSSSSSSSSSGGRGFSKSKIKSRKKKASQKNTNRKFDNNNKPVPNYQRFHA